jgi:Icc-related predicted phosphoesterase
MAKVKILHFSDLHDDYAALDALKNYINSRSDIGLVVFSGDLLGPCLSGKQAHDSHQDLETMIKSSDKKIESFEDLKTAMEKCRTSNNPKERKAAERYPAAEKSFDKTSSEHYQRFKAEISQIKAPTMIIPGNWDNPAKYAEILKENNIHGGVAKLENLVLAGYGGANMATLYVPQTRGMPYSDEQFKKILKEAHPDIIVSHMPPKGMLDGKEKIGSQALADYIQSAHPKLVLCGHSHGYGVMKVDGTTIVNAGNLGKYFNQKTYGTFAEIEIDDDRITVTHYQISPDGKVTQIKGEQK